VHERLAAVIGRVDSLEGMLSGSDTGRSQELEELKAIKDVHAQAMKRLEATPSRVEDLERLFTESESLREGQCQLLVELREANDKHSASLWSLEAEHKNLFELHRGSREGYEQLHRAHLSLVDQIGLLDKAARDSEEKHDRHERRIEGVNGHCASVLGRLDSMERLLGDTSDKHSKELEELKATQEVHAQGVERLEERMEHVERLVLTAATDHAQELQAVKDAQTMLEGTMEAAAKECSQRLERSLDEVAARHGAELGPLVALQAEQAKDLSAVRAAQAALPGRLCSLERLLGEAEDRQLRELQALRESHERQEASAKAIELQHAALGKRLDRAEEQVDGSSSRFSQELAGLQASHAKTEMEVTRFAKEEKARTLVQCSLADRVSTLEKTIDDKFDRIDSRLSVVRGIWARDREQLLGAYRQIDQVTETLQREVLVKEELSAELREAYDRLRRGTPHSRGEMPPPVPETPTSPLSSRPSSCPRGTHGARGSSPRGTSPRLHCDWDEALKRMQAEGIVHTDRGRNESSVSTTLLPAWS